MFDILSQKRCSDCGDWKDRSEFYKEKRVSDGLRARCKTCVLKDNARWRAEHPEFDPEYSRKRIAADPNGERARKALWFAARPGRHSAYNCNYRSRKNGNDGEITVEEWLQLKEYYDYTCLCCGRREPEIKLETDHIIPIAHDGPNTIDNIQPLCEPCNRHKFTKHTDYRY